MSSLNRQVLLASAMLGASMNMMAVPARRIEVRPNDAPGISAMPFDILRLMAGRGVPGRASPRYIKRPLRTVAQEKRRARKARNIRRHRIAMKRRGRT